MSKARKSNISQSFTLDLVFFPINVWLMNSEKCVQSSPLKHSVQHHYSALSNQSLKCNTEAKNWFSFVFCTLKYKKATNTKETN